MVCALSACSEGPKLSKQEAQLLDTVMFVFSGVEDNTRDGEKAQPWQRIVRNDSIEFLRVGTNGIGSSDDEENKKLRQSKYVRYVLKVSSPANCVFSIEERNEFSKGDSQEDFTAYSHVNDLNSHTFNLADANTFKLEYVSPGANPCLLIEGPRAECTRWGYCHNGWNSQLSGLEGDRFYGQDEVQRRERAIELIKKTCPGKRY